jgi:hypothetical protein
LASGSASGASLIFWRRCTSHDAPESAWRVPPASETQGTREAAGEAEASVRRAARVDANHVEIVDGLRAMGVSVQSLAAVGDGCPDLLCGFRTVNIVIEVKAEGKKLKPRQKTWHREWRGTAHVVWSLADAIQVMKHYGLRAA